MIAIICALDKELASFIKDIKRQEILTILNYQFIRGTINENEVVLTKSGIGKMASSIVTTLLIEHFKPSLIINSGIAGGYGDKVQPLDTLIVDKVGCYDIDMRLDGLAYGCFKEEERLLENEVHLLNSLNYPIHYGTILSADTFQSDADYMNKIINQYYPHEEVLAVDMESYSVALTSTLNHTKWLVIRTISDIIGKPQQIDSYYAFSETAAERSYLLIKNNFLNNRH